MMREEETKDDNTVEEEMGEAEEEEEEEEDLIATEMENQFGEETTQVSNLTKYQLYTVMYDQ